MAKKQLPVHVAQQRLTKASAKKTIAAKQQRSDFVAKVMGAGVEVVTRSARTGQLIDRTRAAKSAPFTGQYRRATPR